MNVYDRISVVLREGVDTMSYKEDVHMIKALADENRLRIFGMHHGEKCAHVILEVIHYPINSFSSYEVSCDCGLVDSRKRWAMDALLNSEEGKKRFKDMFLIILKPLIRIGGCSCCDITKIIYTLTIKR